MCARNRARKGSPYPRRSSYAPSQRLGLERSRAGYRREVPVSESYLDAADPATGPLEAMIEQELRAIVVDCFPKLEREQRQVLTMRVEGLKYGEIASRLGVNENTVATWVSRGIRELGRQVRKRMGAR